MHIAPFDNLNKPIVDVEDNCVPLNYFNIVKLTKGQAFEYRVPGYETCIVPATGSIDIDVAGIHFKSIGGRGEDVWDGEPEGVYVPTDTFALMVCLTDSAEVFVAGAKYDKMLEPFAVRADQIDKVQYGSDDTKTHRKNQTHPRTKTTWQSRPSSGLGTIYSRTGRLVWLSKPQTRYRSFAGRNPP